MNCPCVQLAPVRWSGLTITASPIVPCWRAGILLEAGNAMPQARTYGYAVVASHFVRVGCWAVALCSGAVDAAAVRLINAEQGREIAAAALGQEEPVRGTQDCSHLVHQIYGVAGYEYPYASSFELYAGHG